MDLYQKLAGTEGVKFANGRKPGPKIASARSSYSTATAQLSDETIQSHARKVGTAVLRRRDIVAMSLGAAGSPAAAGGRDVLQIFATRHSVDTAVAPRLIKIEDSRTDVT